MPVVGKVAMLCPDRVDSDVLSFCRCFSGVWRGDVGHVVGDQNESPKHGAILSRLCYQQPAGHRVLKLCCGGIHIFIFIYIYTTDTQSHHVFCLFLSCFIGDLLLFVKQNWRNYFYVEVSDTLFLSDLFSVFYFVYKPWLKLVTVKNVCPDMLLWYPVKVLHKAEGV